jgi:hypothetical protein
MSNVKQAFSSVSTMSATIMTNLVSSSTSGWQSAEVDNSSNLYMDAICQTRFTFAKTNPANDKAVYIYTWGAVDTDHTYSMGSTQGLVTIQSDNNLKLAAIVAYPSSGITAWSSPFSIAQCYGGIMPARWGLAVLNYSGAALTDALNPVVQYRGVYATADTANL